MHAFFRFCAAACLLCLPFACVLDRTPTTASGRVCEDAEDCRAILCTCRSGEVVRHKGCVNERCQEPEDWCQRACEDLGGWEPRDAGLTLCNDHPDCPENVCRCADGTRAQGSLCEFDGVCADSVGLCPQKCEPYGGWADCLPSGTACEPFTSGCCNGFCDEGAVCR